MTIIFDHLKPRVLPSATPSQVQMSLYRGDALHYPDYTGGRLNTRPEQACVGLFAGSLNYKLLTNSQKTVVLEEGLPEGDYRRWQDIRAWTDDIAVRLKGNARRQMLL